VFLNLNTKFNYIIYEVKIEWKVYDCEKNSLILPPKIQDF